ncbi:hypothetical protein CCR75_003367 [Bremia lactucae]|uniref:Uncharacterized protein n=1 Tax=Bremia lactucae TaxID=4779 RepID=A0A976FI37_BRELC|nr:hypothetical protein CCR75_003367 [Bremia lactucae]
MQQTSTASFFPTAKELTSGVQWFRDHPVLAAAAAAAVSIITYLNAYDLPEASAMQAGDSLNAISASHKRPLSTCYKGSPAFVRKESLPLVRKSSSRGESDEKLSAAVSWCDEHGGSLTQVFEDETLPRIPKGCGLSDRKEDVRDDAGRSCEFALQHHHTCGLCKSGSQQEMDVEAQTASPQWGWYVPITPPQEQFQSTESECIEKRQFSRAAVPLLPRTTSGQIL